VEVGLGGFWGGGGGGGREGAGRGGGGGGVELLRHKKKVLEKFQKQSCPERSVSLLEPYILEQTLYNTFVSASVAT